MAVIGAVPDHRHYTAGFGPSGAHDDWPESEGVRDSRHPGPALIYPRAEMAAFIHGAKVNGFDEMTVKNMARSHRTE